MISTLLSSGREADCFLSFSRLFLQILFFASESLSPSSPRLDYLLVKQWCRHSLPHAKASFACYWCILFFVAFFLLLFLLSFCLSLSLALSSIFARAAKPLLLFFRAAPLAALFQGRLYLRVSFCLSPATIAVFYTRYFRVPFRDTRVRLKNEFARGRATPEYSCRCLVSGPTE